MNDRLLVDGSDHIRGVTWKAAGNSGFQKERFGRGEVDAQTKGGRASAFIQQWTADEVDGQAMIVAGGVAEAREIGCGPVLAGGIQPTEADDQIAQGGQVLRSVAGVDRRSIFAEGDIAHVVDRFDAPMAAAQALQLRRVHLRVGAAAQDDFSVLGDLKAFEIVSGADDHGGLDGVWEAALLGCEFKGIDLAGFMASMALGNGDVRRGKKRLSARETGGPVCRRALVDWL